MCDALTVQCEAKLLNQAMNDEMLFSSVFCRLSLTRQQTKQINVLFIVIQK